MSEKINPTIVFIRGLPGSGKSYLASKLATKIGLDKSIVLDPDDINYQSDEYIHHSKTLSNNDVDKQLHPYRFLRAKAFQAILSNKIVIWNQPFTNTATFQKVIAKLQDFALQNKKTLKLLIVEVEVDVDTAKKRVNERKYSGGHGPSDNTFNHYSNDYISFKNKSIKTISVNGADDINKSVDKVIKTLTD